MENFQSELIDIITKDKLFKEKDLENFWVIITTKGIFVASNGKILYDTQEQAWRSWYNEVRWSVKRGYHKYEAEKANYQGDWYYYKTKLTGTKVWNTFKNTMLEDYGFQIVRLKDAKGNVCCESRAEGEC